MGYDIGPKIGIDGEAEFRAQINQINTVVKTLGTEMQEVASRFDKQQDSEEALIAKNKVLTKEIEEQRKKLDLLKQGVQESTKKYGEADSKTLKWQQSVNRAAAELNKMENQLRENTASLDKLEAGLDESENALEDVKDNIKDVDESLEDAEKSASSFGDVFQASLAADLVVGAIQSIIGAFKQWAEESKEIRKIMASLEVSSQKAGYGADQTKESYLQLYGVLADNQTAATTTANLQALGLEQERLREITDGVIGAWATYGDSIPIDGLAEAINETAKAGQVTGTFADVLNWAGTSEDDFNAKLEKLGNESDRVNLIMQELTDQGLMEAGKAWQQNNQSLVDANRAMAEYESVSAELGETVEPVLTAIQEGMNAVLGTLLQLASEVDFVAIADGIRQVFDFFTQLANGMQDGTISITDAIQMIREKSEMILSGLADRLRENLPVLMQTGQQMLSFLAEGIATGLPELFSDGTEALNQFIQGILQELPEMIALAGDIISTLLDAILTALPQLVESGVKLIGQLAMGILNNLPAIAEASKNVIAQLIMTILSHMPEILQKGIELIGQLAAGIIRAIPQVVATIPQVITGIQTKFSATNWAEVGINIIKGIRDGVANAAKMLIDAVKDVASQALDGLKRFLGIHSPSAVMRDEVGRQITAGIAEGILADKEYAKKSAEEVSQAILKAAQQKLSNYKVYHELTLADEAGFWDEIRKETKEGTQARIDADQKYLEAKKKLDDKLISIEKNYRDKVSKVHENLSKDIKAAWESYHKEVDSLTDSIKSQMGLFDQFEAKTKYTTADLLKNLQSQVDGLKDWQRSIHILESRGLPDGFLSELEEMGVSAAGDVALLTQMTDKELQQYISLWEQKNSIAREAAVDQLEPLLEDTRNQIKQLREDARKELADYQEEYSAAMREIGAAMSQPIEQVKNELTKSFTEVIGVIANTVGAQSGSSENQEKYRQISDNVLASVSNLPAEMQSVGVDTIDGIIAGLMENAGRLYEVMASIMRETIEAAQQEAEIHSPSAVMRELIGKNLMAGLAEGLKIYQGMAVKAAGEATQNVLSAFPQNLEMPTYANGTAAAYNQMTDRLGNLRVVLQDGTIVGKLSPAINREIGGYTRMDERYYT